MRKAKKTPTEIHVGRYQLGIQMVDLFVVPRETGGWMYGVGDDSQHSRIRVGINYDYWERVVAVFLHEVTEMCYSDLNMRFRPDQDWASASDGYRFHFNHNQFSEAIARVGSFAAHALPDLAKAYKKWGPK